MKTTYALLAAGLLLATAGIGMAQPSITAQPQPGTNMVGTTATFEVSATGRGAPGVFRDWVEENSPGGIGNSFDVVMWSAVTRRPG